MPGSREAPRLELKGVLGSRTLRELWPVVEGLTDLSDQQEDLGSWYPNSLPPVSTPAGASLGLDPAEAEGQEPGCRPSLGLWHGLDAKGQGEPRQGMGVPHLQRQVQPA